MEINIANRKIGNAHPPFVIAEISGNHNRLLDSALAIVEAAEASVLGRNLITQM